VVVGHRRCRGSRRRRSRRVSLLPPCDRGKDNGQDGDRNQRQRNAGSLGGYGLGVLAGSGSLPFAHDSF